MNKEDAVLIERIKTGIAKCIGKHKAATSKYIRTKLEQDGFGRVSDVKVREIIRHLRKSHNMFICGDSNGFYIAASMEERMHQIESLKSRMAEIKETMEALQQIDLNERKQMQMQL